METLPSWWKSHHATQLCDRAAWLLQLKCFVFSLKDIASSCTGRECCRPLQLLNTYSTLQVSQVNLLDPLWSLLTDRLVCSACRPLLQSWERELKWAKKVGSGWVRAIPRGKAWSHITKSLLYHDSQLTAWIIDRPQATGRYLNVVIYSIYCCGPYEWERNFISQIFGKGIMFTLDIKSVAGGWILMLMSSHALILHSLHDSGIQVYFILWRILL